MLGKTGPAEYYQLSTILVTTIPPISANRLLINMYSSARGEQERDTTSFAVHIHPSRKSNVQHEDIELASISMEDTRADEGGEDPHA